MITNEESTEIVNFMGACARAWPYKLHVYSEMHYFFKNLLL